MPEPATLDPVVCDTGPLVALLKIDHLHLLTALFGSVLVPADVVAELSCANRLPEAEKIMSTPGIQSVSLAKLPERMLSAELGVGEASVIALAVERKVSLVLLDEKKARRVATVAFNLKVIGTGGLLLRAKRSGLVAVVRPLIEQMRQKGYFLSDRLVHEICVRCGE